MLSLNIDTKDKAQTYIIYKTVTVIMDIDLLLNLNIVDTSRTKDTQTDQYSDFSIFLKKDERKYIPKTIKLISVASALSTQH
jgi:hypothetical protein